MTNEQREDIQTIRGAVQFMIQNRPGSCGLTFLITYNMLCVEGTHEQWIKFARHYAPRLNARDGMCADGRYHLRKVMRVIGQRRRRGLLDIFTEPRLPKRTSRPGDTLTVDEVNYMDEMWRRYNDAACPDCGSLPLSFREHPVVKCRKCNASFTGISTFGIVNIETRRLTDDQTADPRATDPAVA